MRSLSRLLVIIYLLALALPALAQQPEPASAPAADGVTAEEPASSAAMDIGETPAAEDEDEPAERPDPATAKVSMSFDKADVNSVVKFISMSSGVPIVCDPELKGNVTIISLEKITLNDAFEVVNAALRVRGYTMVGGLDSKVIRVVTLKKAVSDNVDVRTGKEPSEVLPGDNMVTQVMSLQYASADKLKEELKPLVADDQANIVAIVSTNTLIVTDSAANVNRIAEIVKELDKDTSDIIEIEIHRCENSSAQAMVDTLLKIFPPAQPAGGKQPGQPGGPPRGPDGQPQPNVKGDGDGLISLKGEIRIAADERTNSIIISAAKDKIALVLEVVEKLDTDTQPEVKARVFTLEYADAKIVAEQLNQLFEQPQGGITGGTTRRYPWDFGGGGSQGQQTSYAGLKRNVVVADIRTNSVIVTATDQNMGAFEEMIKKLDSPEVLSQITRHFPLKYAKADDLADTLNRLFRGEYRRSSSIYDYIFGGYNRRDDEGGPLAQLRDITVVAEEKTNALLVTGPPNAFSVVEELIEKLDKRTAQVFIEVAIVDVTLDKDTKFGIEWNWRSTGTASDGTPVEETGSTDFGLDREELGLKYSVLTDNLDILLHALQTRNDVKVLTTPTLTTADNVEARISIGRDVPFISSETETEGGNFRRTVEFKKVAVALTVTPHVNEASDVIALDVHQTINEIIGYEPELSAPIIADREAQTRIMVRDGQTIVIGGIMKENRDKITKAVPLLSEIPLIGELFKSREWRTEQSELMVFLTPHVLVDDDATSAVTKETIESLSVKPKAVTEPLTVTIEAPEIEE